MYVIDYKSHEWKVDQQYPNNTAIISTDNFTIFGCVLLSKFAFNALVNLTEVQQKYSLLQLHFTASTCKQNLML